MSLTFDINLVTLVNVIWSEKSSKAPSILYLKTSLHNVSRNTITKFGSLLSSIQVDKIPCPSYFISYRQPEKKLVYKRIKTIELLFTPKKEQKQFEICFICVHNSIIKLKKNAEIFHSLKSNPAKTN